MPIVPIFPMPEVFMHKMFRLGAAILVLAAISYAEPVEALQQESASLASALATEKDSSANILERPANLHVENVPLEEALVRLEHAAGVAVAYSPTLLPDDRVTCACTGTTVGDAVQKILRGTSLEMAVLVDHVVIRERRTRQIQTMNVDWAPEPVDAAASAREAGGGMSFFPPPVTQEGTITGRVTDARTGQPIQAAQVHIPEIGLGVLSQASGRFLLTNVPAGTHTVRVERIGYSSASQEVTVRADEAVQVTFTISQQALALDEIVVTGTAGGTQRRSVGNVVGQLDAGEATEVSPAMNVEQLIGQREAGVQFTNPAGMVGSGGNLRVRGVSSPAMGNEPIIYVDGVRINNERTGASVRGGRHHRPLNDYNMEDIESIEIIKGPAAATLYGTEASNGVIQIITKKGIEGRPTFDLTVRQGAQFYLNPGSLVRDIAGRHPETGEFVTVNVFELEEEAGRSPFRTGHMQTYMGSIRGGSDALRYYMSAEWQDNEGVELSNWQKRVNTRLNLAANLTDELSVQTNVGYGQIDTRYGAQALSTWGQMVWGSPEYLADARRAYYSTPPDVAKRVEAMGDHTRFVASVQADHNPWDWFRQRVTVGIQEDSDLNSSFTPLQPPGGDEPGGIRFFGSDADGEKELDQFDTRNTTLDYAGTVTTWLTDDLQSATSFGAQYYAKQRHETMAQGEGFPSPSVSTVSAAARVQGGESWIENKTVGGYLQQSLDWKERRVLTAAVRADNNSAFGAEFDAAIYPKVSGTWLISDEPFWDVGFVDALRLRGAWGASGQQPDVFAAVRLYDAITGPGDRSAVSPGTIGNPELKPERSAELELGFDAAILDERVELEFTHYRRTTTDLIVPRRVPPSRGFPGTQFVNVGEVRNWGTEVAVDTRVLESASFAWDLGVNYATQHSKIEDLAGLEISPIHQEGWPLGGIFWQKVLSADFGEDGVTPTNLMCDGGTGKQGLEQGGSPVPCADAPRVWFGQRQPTWLGNVNTTVSFGQNLRIFAMVDFRGGHHTTEGELLAGHTTFTNTPEVNPITDPVLQAYRIAIQRDPAAIFDASFAKLREVSLNYRLPDAWTRGVSSASINVSARNLATIWDAQEPKFGHKMADPETAQNPTTEFGGYTQMTAPQTQQLITTLRVTF